MPFRGKLEYLGYQFSSVQSSPVTWSCLTLCDPMKLQYLRLPCPSPPPRTCSSSCPTSWWCHPNISSSIIPFPLASIFPSIRIFSTESVLHIKWPNYWHFSISPSNEHPGLIWVDPGWTGWISLQSKGLSRVFSNTTVQKHQFFGAQLSLQSNSHIHTWPLEKQPWLDGPLLAK